MSRIAKRLITSPLAAIQIVVVPAHSPIAIHKF